MEFATYLPYEFWVLPIEEQMDFAVLAHRRGMQWADDVDFTELQEITLIEADVLIRKVECQIAALAST